MLALLSTLSPYRYIIAAGAILIALGGIYFKGYSDGKQHVQVLWDADKKAIAEAAAIQAADTAQKIAAAQHTTEDISNDYQQKIAQIRAYYSGHTDSALVSGVCVNSAAGTSPVSAVPDTAARSNEGATNKEPARADLLSACAETTQQLISLQNWVLHQKENNP